MSHHVSKNLLSFLGGAGVGALVMYLFDPDQGAQRRHSTARGLRRTGGSISEAVSSATQFVGHQIGQYGRSASAGVGSVAAILAEKAGDLGESASGALSRPGRRAIQHLRGQARQISSQLSSAAGYRRPSPWVRGLWAAGFVALGAGAMYMLDPSAGGRRRALARDKVRSGVGHTSAAAGKTARHLWNRAAGAGAELRGRFTRRAASDLTIENRIRSELGNSVSNAQAITVSSNGGCVTVSGWVRPDEVDPLLKCIWGTSGVVDLVNELQVQEHAGAISPGSECV